MKFLEAVTILGNDVLIPIDRIKYIYISYKNGYEITIESDDGNWIECFGHDQEKAYKRYEKIKGIVEGG